VTLLKNQREKKGESKKRKKKGLSKGEQPEK